MSRAPGTMTDPSVFEGRQQLGKLQREMRFGQWGRLRARIDEVTVESMSDGASAAVTELAEGIGAKIEQGEMVNDGDVVREGQHEATVQCFAVPPMQ